MSWFSKVAKKAAKGLGKLGLAAAKSTPLGKVIVPAASKIVGALAATRKNAQAAKIKLEPVSVRASIVKSRIQAPGKLSAPSLGDATTMPGGAPLSGQRKASRKRVAAPPKAKRSKSKGKASTGKRAAPKGGLDLKKLSREWNAAGKPGKWIDWVKAHR